MAKLTGRYYTHEKVADSGIKILINEISKLDKNIIKVADPFGGDGRLIYWLIKEWRVSLHSPKRWKVYLWDIDQSGFENAEKNFNELKNEGIDIECSIKCEDSFKIALNHIEEFDIVVTNPPWELLKPDRRELKHLNECEKIEYISALRSYDALISDTYSLSQPKSKFAGWGTNLSRVGLELSMKILKTDGIAMIVLPGSFFADEQSVNIRKFLFEKWTIKNIFSYPAEAKLFKNADTSCTNMVFLNTRNYDTANKVHLTLFDKNLNLRNSDTINLNSDFIKENGYAIPINLGPEGFHLLEKLNEKFSKWGTLEKNGDTSLWAGREMDETKSQDWLVNGGSGPTFIKGKMINRYKIVKIPFEHVSKKNWVPPASIQHEKIVWRDVSRPNQKRRIIATIVAPNIVAGNSLGVCFFKDQNKNALRFLLGIMNSLCFEYQIRAHLATGHISLSSIRKVSIPDTSQYKNHEFIVNQVERALEGDISAEFKLEAYIAKEVYGITIEEFRILLRIFEKLSETEKNKLVDEFNLL